MDVVDEAFYRLTVAQRDGAWREVETLKALVRGLEERCRERDALLARAAALFDGDPDDVKGWLGPKGASGMYASSRRTWAKIEAWLRDNGVDDEARTSQREAAVTLLREAVFGPVPEDWEERALALVGPQDWTTTVRRNEPLQGLHHASCTCGWQGPNRADGRHAADDARQHSALQHIGGAS